MPCRLKPLCVWKPDERLLLVFVALRFRIPGRKISFACWIALISILTDTSKTNCSWLVTMKYVIIHVYDLRFPLQVLIVMTDGISQDGVVRPSRDLRNTGVRILALGIGKKFRRVQLIQMAASRRYVFNADFRSLSRVVRSIKRTACGGD